MKAVCTDRKCSESVTVSDQPYQEYLQSLQRTFSARVAGEPLFTTDAKDLFEAYLAAIPAAERQTYACHTCRDFIHRFGGLVTIDEKGQTRSLFWDPKESPTVLRPSITKLEAMVRRGKVTGVFLSAEDVWGKPSTGVWNHLAVVPPSALIYRRFIPMASQAVAEKHEDFLQITRALGEYSENLLQQAVTLLEADQLYRSEKVLGPVKWLRDLKFATSALRGEAKQNLIWRTVALAPAGFCHPRSGMAGTLLDDLATGYPYAEVARRFAQKMHPLQYQRPQAAPTAGNIAQAEKVVEQLGIKTALQRRFARLDEVKALWVPAPPPMVPPANGVFGHLQPKGKHPEPAPLKTPPVTMTWEKFQRVVLPEARSIDLYVGQCPQSFMALVTAVDPDAAPLLQWDHPEHRNPVSWYFWSGGSSPHQWGLDSNRFHPVTAIALYPDMWGEQPNAYTHHAKGVTLFLDNMRETRNGGGGLFPEMLRSELHGIRATLEAYSRHEELSGREEGSACGLGLRAGETWNAHLRVKTATGTTEYRLDRWD